MATPPTQQPTELSAWEHFLRSNYVTWFTDWLLGFGGKSAHMVLTFTMLYMSAQLFPGVKTPDALNLVVFLIQMFALDMGGMGLASLARQARAEGNEAGADKAQQLSRWLIGIMIASIVSVCLEQAINHILHDNKGAQTYIDAIKIVVEVVLVVARAICAVLYGPVIHALNEGTVTYQQDMQNLRQEHESLTATVTSLRTEVEHYQQQASGLQKELSGAQLEASQLLQDLTDEQRRSSTLQEELEAGQGDTTTQRKQLNAALTEVDTLRTQLEGKTQEVESLKEALAGSHEMQESRVQQLLAAEQKRASSLLSQLEAEQGAVTIQRQQLNSTNLQVIDLTAKLEAASRRLANLQNAEKQVEDLATKVQEKEQDCERANGRIAELVVKLREAQSVKASPHSQGNITPIDQARVKVRASDNEIIAYMKEHPNMKVPEVASHFEVTARTIYNVLKRQETGEKEAVGEA